MLMAGIPIFVTIQFQAKINISKTMVTDAGFTALAGIPTLCHVDAEVRHLHQFEPTFVAFLEPTFGVFSALHHPHVPVTCSNSQRSE